MSMNIRSKFIIILIFLIIGTYIGFSQKFSLKTSIDTNRIELGDQINLIYSIKKKEEVNVIFPFIGTDLTNGIEVLGRPVIDSTKLREGSWEISLQLLITSFDTGIYYIPPQKFIIKEQQFIDTVLSTATYLEVFGVAIDTTSTIRDIKPPEKVPATLGEILLYIAAALLVGAIIYFIIQFLRNRKRKENIFIPSKPEEPPHITAFRELDKIKAQKLWQKKQVKEYYTRITYVIRWYIFKRFNIHALEETSDEILYFMKSLDLGNVNYNKLENLLNLADLVKFAKGEPEPEENIVHLDNAYEFIQNTKDFESKDSAFTDIEIENKGDHE